MSAATMPHIPPTASLLLQPGEGLGPLSLSASLFSIITTLLQHKSTFPRLDISFNSTNPVTNPIYVDLETNGLRLRFDGQSQHLELIQVTEFGKLGLVYAETNLRHHLMCASGLIVVVMARRHFDLCIRLLDRLRRESWSKRPRPHRKCIYSHIRGLHSSSPYRRMRPNPRPIRNC